ncbi:hypothetical protein GCM10027517_02460 [Phycicoccus ginsengisoli]
MSEPSSGVPHEVVDSEVGPSPEPAPESVELDVDEDKLEAWDKVKGDYQVDPGGEPIPNSQDVRVAPGDEDDDDEENVGAPGPA